MMKSYRALLLLQALCLSSIILEGMEKPQETYKGPMDAEWFYDKNNPFTLANALHQQQEWDAAAQMYKVKLELNMLLLDLKKYIAHLREDKNINPTLKIDHNILVFPAIDNFNIADDYSQNMARLNLAACLMAQRKATKHWSAFDALLNIAESRRISAEKITATQFIFFMQTLDLRENKTILVRTDQVGIGDIFHFLSAASKLKWRTGWDIILSVPNFLKDTLANTANQYDFKLIGAKDPQPITDYETHLIGLLGHLKLSPAQMNPACVMFTAPERAINAVLETIDPVLAQGKNLAVVFVGEKRQATLIGGKQLPRDTSNHGRNLDSEPFNTLIKKYPQLILMDCGNKNSRITIDEDQKNRCLIIPDEKQAFDTIIALARIMSVKQSIIGFGSDNGPTNVFARSLDDKAQDRMAFIIPNSKEHDMRMSGEGPVYKQMISNCWVYKCETPADQTQVIERAYCTMLKLTD